MGVIRTILALSVVFAHTPHPYVFVGGQNAVQMFYMISGFLISYVLLNTAAYRSILIFWSSRALRLYPLYYVVAALTFTAYALFNPAFWNALADLPVAAQAFMAAVNITLIGQDWSLFTTVVQGQLHFVGIPPPPQNSTAIAGLQDFLLVKQSWTLGVELTFYLVAPFIIRHRLILLILLAISLGCRALAIWYDFGMEDPWTYRFFPFELALFIAGALSQQVLLPAVKRLVAKHRQLNFPTYAVVGMAAVCFAYFSIPLPESIKTLALLFALFATLPFLFIFQSENHFDKVIGDISYPLYIGHLLVLLTVAYLVKRYGFVDPSSWTRTLIGVVGALLFAALIKIAVADPIERRRQKMRRMT